MTLMWRDKEVVEVVEYIKRPWADGVAFKTADGALYKDETRFLTIVP